MPEATAPYPLDGKRVWVAGHRGMVGSACVRHLKQRGFENILTAPRDEVDLRESAIGGPPSGGADVGGVALDAGDRARGADELRREHADVADPRADVEHGHPRADARVHEERPGEGGEEAILEREALLLVVGEPEGVAHVAHGLSS